MAELQRLSDLAKKISGRLTGNTLTLILPYFILYTLFLVSISYMRFLEFYTTNWDMGLNMQEMWTTTHGYLMYDSAEYQFFGTLSHLEIHTSYIGIPVAYIYAISPGVLTIIVIQSVAVSLSAVVLFFLALEITSDVRLSLAAVLIYSFNGTLITSVLFDYHWLSFVPLEVFLLFYALRKKRFVWAVPTIAAGCLTQDVFPFIAMGVLLFHFIETRNFNRNPLTLIFGNAGAIYVFLVAECLLFFLFLRFLQLNFIPQLLGNQSAIPIIRTYVIEKLSLPTFNLSNLSEVESYWLISYACMGFLPILKPRHFVMVAPWLYETLFGLHKSVTFGYMYSFVTLSLLAPALIYSFKEIYDEERKVRLKVILPIIVFLAVILTYLFMNGYSVWLLITHYKLWFEVAAAAGVGTFAALLIVMRVIPQLRLSFRPSFLIVVLIISLLLFNFGISPLNSNNDPQLGGYSFSYHVPSQAAYINTIEANIPNHSLILASNNLFPLVADHRNSYSMFWFYSNLVFSPFNGSRPPDYLLIDTSEMAQVPHWLISMINNDTLGLKLEITGNSYPGNIYLYELGYHGSTILN